MSSFENIFAGEAAYVITHVVNARKCRLLLLGMQRRIILGREAEACSSAYSWPMTSAV